MTKITDLNRDTLQALRPEIDAALAELGQRFGIKLTAGNGSFAGDHAHFKLNIVVDDQTVRDAAEQASFNLYCSLFDLLPSDRGLEFSAGRARYRLLGFEMKRRKYPLRVLNLADQKVVLLT